MVRALEMSATWVASSLGRASMLVALVACRDAAPVIPPSATSTSVRCAQQRRLVVSYRRSLDEGRLLRALPKTELGQDGCTAEAKELARVALEAGAALGDEDAVKRWSQRLGASYHPPPLFAPDTPPRAIADDVSVAYEHALTAYAGSQWASAGELGFSVGVSGGALGIEGFILAARAAERAGDPRRAARMWARAYYAQCAKGAACSAYFPREDLFGRVALYPHYKPWSAVERCVYGESEEGWVTNGTWHITAVHRGIRIREIPSRILLEHIERPEGAEVVCFSDGGLKRVSYTTSPLRLLLGSRGAPWTSLALPAFATPGPFFFVANDGRAIFPAQTGGGDREQFTFTAFEPTSGAFKKPPRDMDPASMLGEVTPGGDYYTSYRARGSKAGIARIQLSTSRWDTVLPPSDVPGVMEAGPVDAEGRLMVRASGKILWLDRAGKILGQMADPIESASSQSRLGVIQPSSIVWRAPGASSLERADLASGVVADAGLVWHAPRETWRLDLHDLERALGKALRGSEDGLSGFTIALAEDPIIEINSPGQKPLRVVLTADRRGAMVMRVDGHFERVGQIPAPFHAAASCGPPPRQHPPTVGERAWPIDVCVAGMEESGLTAMWFDDARKAPASPLSQHAGPVTKQGE